MEVLESARHPISATGDLTTSRGTISRQGIDQHSSVRKCSPTGRSAISLTERTPKPDSDTLIKSH
jgi:hypothetical protein